MSHLSIDRAETTLEELAWRIKYLAEAGGRIIIDAQGDLSSDYEPQLQTLFQTIYDLAGPLHEGIEEIETARERAAA